jgi:hypothetical protein
MSALDKLNAKANIVKTEEVEKKPVTNKAPKEKKTAQVPKKTPVATNKRTVAKEEKEGNDTKVANKHPGGRTNTRGIAGKDYKMMNIAVPIDVYEKLKEASNGNMTFYINSLLKNSVD